MPKLHLSITLISWLKAILTLNVYAELVITLGIAGIFYGGLLLLLRIVTIKELLGLMKTALR